MKRRGLLVFLLACVMVFTLALPVESLAQDDLKVITSVLQIDAATQDRVLTHINETLQDNRWNTLIAERLGYKIEYSWVVSDSEQYNQKFNAALAAADIPDIMRLDKVKMGQCVEAGLLAEMGSLIEEYASPLLKQILADGGDAPRLSCTFDGVQYALPVVDADIERGSVLWLRTDWLDKTGLEAPKTIDELIVVLQAFMEIAGEGAVGLCQCKYPFGFNANSRFNGFFYGYGAYPEMWLERDGQLVYGSVQPEMKPALAKLNEMYNLGLFDPEFIVMDENKAAEAIISGKCGALYGAHWSSLAPLQDNVMADPEADWLPFDLPSADGSPTIVGTELATGTWFAASAKCEYPQVIVELANLYCEKTFDPELQEYAFYSNPGGDAEGVWKLSPVYMMTPLKNIDTTRAIRPHLESEDPGDLYGEQLTMYEYTLAGMKGDRQMWGWMRVFGIDGACQVQYEQQYLPGETYLSRFYGAPTETMNSNQSILTSALNEAIVKIITGQSPLDSFDDAVNAWFMGGGQDITDEVNAWYADQQQ
ncbi:MAG: extracellular solute-binding protein [Christensenellales bacterium]|jgi:putative aldouronate transport system substrate-binding protein